MLADPHWSLGGGRSQLGVFILWRTGDVSWPYSALWSGPLLRTHQAVLRRRSTAMIPGKADSNFIMVRRTEPGVMPWSSSAKDGETGVAYRASCHAEDQTGANNPKASY